MSVRVDEHGFPVAEVRYPMPGPVSYGDPDAVAVQRAELGLSDDASGMSDEGGEGKLGDPEPAAPVDPATPADPAKSSTAAS